MTLATLGLGAVLSPLQGLGFGFGYGYGVRLGYHSFKPSKSKDITGMRLSPNPLIAGQGMGLASADEMTGGKVADKLELMEPQTPEPALIAESAKTVEQPEYKNATMVYSPYSYIKPRRQSSFASIEELRAFKKGEDPQTRKIVAEYLRRNKLNQSLYNKKNRHY